jgi:putative colanic acid biosynthesis UDP-glucose lipid carrier transferase
MTVSYVRTARHAAYGDDSQRPAFLSDEVTNGAFSSGTMQDCDVPSDGVVQRQMPLPDILVAPAPRKSRLAKRVLDVGLASFLLLALSPLLLIVAAIIRLESPGKIIFTQRRVGYHGQIFRIYKFRSMKVMEDGAEVSSAKRSDSRVTRVGYWIRRTSIDELPQLFNVLRGEMSLVGPRPHAVAHDIYYSNMIHYYKQRNQAKPGLTGLAQINGLRGEVRSVDEMTRRVRHDIWYIHNQTILLDLLIVMCTLKHLVINSDYY